MPADKNGVPRKWRKQGRIIKFCLYLSAPECPQDPSRTPAPARPQHDHGPRHPETWGSAGRPKQFQRTMRVQIAAFCYLHAHGTPWVGGRGSFPHLAQA